MQVTILEEAFYKWAIRGFGYSFMDSAADPDEFYTEEKFKRIEKTALSHANRGLGANKFRRQVMLALDIRAPRFWFSEFDTYKISTVAQSTSTMHTLQKRDLDDSDFEDGCPDDILNCVNSAIRMKSLPVQAIKSLLPEGYLQRRLVTLNYEVLATIINQRKNHRLPQWAVFINSIYDQCEHPELLPEFPYQMDRR